MKIRTSRSLIIWGVGLGVSSFLMMLLDFYSIHQFVLPFSPLEFKSFVASLGLGILLSIRRQSRQPEIPFRFSNGIRTGFLLSICVGLSWASLSAIYTAAVPSYASQMIAESSKEVSLATASESVGVHLGAELLYSPSGQFLSKLFISTIIGTLLSLIMTLILQWSNRSAQGAQSSSKSV